MLLFSFAVWIKERNGDSSTSENGLHPKGPKKQHTESCDEELRGSKQPSPAHRLVRVEPNTRLHITEHIANNYSENETDSDILSQDSRENNEDIRGWTWDMIDMHTVISSDSEDDAAPVKPLLQDGLSEWMNKFGIRHNAGDELLKILNKSQCVKAGLLETYIYMYGWMDMSCVPKLLHHYVVLNLHIYADVCMHVCNSIDEKK